MIRGGANPLENYDYNLTPPSTEFRSGEDPHPWEDYEQAAPDAVIESIMSDIACPKCGERELMLDGDLARAECSECGLVLPLTAILPLAGKARFSLADAINEVTR